MTTALWIVLKIILVLLLLATVYIILTMPRIKNPDHEHFLHWYYAHRGLYDNLKGIPENSLLAFERAASAGYGIEMDVQLTADKVAVIFHDWDLKRMCGINRKISSMTYAELKEICLLRTAEHIPTLYEALAVVDGRVPLIIELKSNALRTALPRITNDILKDYKGDYCIESFNPLILLWYKHHRPDITRGQLSTNYLRDLGYTNPLLFSLEKLLLNCLSRPDFISYNWKYRKEPSRRLCRKLYHTLSVAWTIQSRNELELCEKDFDLFIFEGFMPAALPTKQAG